MPMSLRFLGYEVNDNELLTQEIIDTWEQVFKENNGTITPVESTGDNLFYFKDSALGENWVLGWVLDAEKNLFQFGPVTKPFPLVSNASTFRERFGIKIEKIEKPVIEVSYEYTSSKEGLDKEEIEYKEAKVQRAGQGTDDLGRPFTEYKDEAGNVVLRITLVEEKKEEVEKIEPIYDYTSNKDDFANAKDYKHNNETFNLSEEGNDEAGKPIKKFTDELGRVRVVLALVEPKEEDKVETPNDTKEEEKKEEVINEYTSDEKVFFDSQEWGVPNATLKRADEGKDELGRPFVNFRDEAGNLKLVLTLTEGKPAEEVKEEPAKEGEAPKIERISIEVNGVQITKVDGQELPERKAELTEVEEIAVKIANEYQENLKERTWDELADGRVLVTDYLYSELVKFNGTNEEKNTVRVQVVFIDTAAKTLSGYTIDADKKSSRATAKAVDALIEETVKNILGTEKVADTAPSEERAEVTE